MSVSIDKYAGQTRNYRQLVWAVARLEVLYGTRVAHDILVTLVEAYEIILANTPPNGSEE